MGIPIWFPEELQALTGLWWSYLEAIEIRSWLAASLYPLVNTKGSSSYSHQGVLFDDLNILFNIIRWSVVLEWSPWWWRVDHGKVRRLGKICRTCRRWKTDIFTSSLSLTLKHRKQLSYKQCSPKPKSKASANVQMFHQPSRHHLNICCTLCWPSRLLQPEVGAWVSFTTATIRKGALKWTEIEKKNSGKITTTIPWKMANCRERRYNGCRLFILFYLEMKSRGRSDQICLFVLSVYW